MYYIGGLNLKTGNKSKSIYEYKAEYGWIKWEQELIVPNGAKNAWDVMEIGSKFCKGVKNVTRGMLGYDAWELVGDSDFCFKHIFDE